MPDPSPGQVADAAKPHAAAPDPATPTSLSNETQMLYELQKPFVEPLLRMFRLNNTAIDALVYDAGDNKLHCLNLTSALVWKHCDGQTTVRELAVMLQRELGVPAAEPLVYLALEQLGSRRLLDPLPAEPAAMRQGRRDMLRKVALAALRSS